MRFLEALDAFALGVEAEGRAVVLCGDLNVALTDRDVHPKERKPRAIGQLPEERALLDRIIGRGLVDVTARSTRTTTTCSRGGRRGATCASATSAGVSTTCWRRDAPRAARRHAYRNGRLAPAITPARGDLRLTRGSRLVPRYHVISSHPTDTASCRGLSTVRGVCRWPRYGAASPRHARQG